jgi:hypothetical protein
MTLQLNRCCRAMLYQPGVGLCHTAKDTAAAHVRVACCSSTHLLHDPAPQASAMCIGLCYCCRCSGIHLGDCMLCHMLCVRLSPVGVVGRPRQLHQSLPLKHILVVVTAHVHAPLIVHVPKQRTWWGRQHIRAGTRSVPAQGLWPAA